MRVTLTPNGGEHEIGCDEIRFTSAKQINDHIRYLKTVRDMLWRNENKKANKASPDAGIQTEEP